MIRVLAFLRHLFRARPVVSRDEIDAALAEAAAARPVEEQFAELSRALERQIEADEKREGRRG